MGLNLLAGLLSISYVTESPLVRATLQKILRENYYQWWQITCVFSDTFIGTHTISIP